MKKIEVLAVLNNPISYSFYFLALVTPLIFSPQNFELFEFPKIILVYFGASLILSLWTAKILVTGKVNFAPTPLFWPILVFLVSQILSTIISADKTTSIFGYYSRFNGGLLSVIALTILYFGAVSNLTKNQGLTLIFLFVISGLISSLWGIPSHFGFDPTCRILTGIWTSKCWSVQFDPTLRIFANFGQPNWMAGFLIMAILVLFGFLAAIKDRSFLIFGVLVNSILFWAFLLTNSRSASLALLISLVILLMILTYLAFWQKVKINFLSIGVTLAVFVILTVFFGQSLLGRVREVKIASTQTQTGPAFAQATAGAPTESGQIRLIVWKGAVEIFKRYPIFGTGPETFGYSYYNVKPVEHNLTTEWNFLYNKAHNEFLNYAATSGILGLGSFLAIIMSYFLLTAHYLLKKSDKIQAFVPSGSAELTVEASGRGETRDKVLITGLVTALISYLIHNFFGFSVVPTVLFFWLALASTILVRVPKVKSIEFKPKTILLLLPIAFLLFSIFILVRFYSADLNFAKGLSSFETGNYQQANFYFEKAINQSPLSQPLFLAYSGYNLAILSQFDENLILEAVNLTEKSLILSRVNLTTVRLAANTYLELSSSNPSYLDKTTELANHLLRLAPTDAETHFQVGQILKIVGKEQEAEIVIKKAIELKPDYQAAIDKLAEWQKEE